MDVRQVGAKLLQDYLDGQGNLDVIGKALMQLIGEKGGQLDIASLVAQLSSNGNVQNLVKSWLGDGANAALDPAQILSIFGNGKVGAFAEQIGIGPDQAAAGSAATLPQLINQFSSGGSLLESAGGVAGMLGMAKKFF
ncbi:hypothetical protein E4T66_02045 [Sinimarinibacterium sp. CAU 1509]|uniref:YidB family protein n=1 Tax=Sinimarinibacterium sp. CAU 1509 TaxID=2562283 RepID=UPI0010AB68B6|nr:YidB family protein [Sinimarinibacterium sp. CAU 1509]TJY65025.1 hypothetical protein E4T66_02045 [Sinimarinibacterium sp. CAU 1509]